MWLPTAPFTSASPIPSNSMSPKSAVIAGATGLVGGFCLDELLASPHYEAVTAIARRQLGVEHAKLRERVVSFDAPHEWDDAVRGNDVFCCLGATMRNAGSRDAFRKVDYQYPLALAEMCKAQGASQFVLVSSIGARAGSRSYYLRVKGELEGALGRLGFASLVIMRPSLLLGTRLERRPGETFAKLVAHIVAPWLHGPFRKYRPVHARTVARVMVEAANVGLYGVHVVESDRIGRGLGG